MLNDHGDHDLNILVHMAFEMYCEYQHLLSRAIRVGEGRIGIIAFSHVPLKYRVDEEYCFSGSSNASATKIGIVSLTHRLLITGGSGLLG